MPGDMKCANVRPLLKKAGLDEENLKSYRPVSNLSFISKILEKVVAVRLQSHLSSNNLYSERQSAYRKAHSTETALIRVTSDILEAIDSGRACVLVLLDLSAAFDTIDHSILLRRLQKYFGISGTALSWFRSYLTDRSQRVIIGDEKSTPATLDFGVPQGSVLGPVLYSMYTTPLSAQINRHQLEHLLYADDSQLYNVFRSLPTAVSHCVHKVEDCVESVRDWMWENKLKLNDEKTEVITFSSRFKPVEPVTIKIGEAVIPSSTVVRDLGVLLDDTLTMEKQVAHVCRSAYYQIRKIAAIRRYLTLAAVKSLMHSLVTSRLDYANSLLVGIPARLMQKLQRVQNTAARVIMRTGKRDHITPVLKELHWLPVQRRVEFKVLVYTHKAVHGDAPQYIKDLVSIKSHACRSDSGIQLYVPRTKTKSYGDRSFKAAAASLWNALPHSMRNMNDCSKFKQALKTHLFIITFN